MNELIQKNWFNLLAEQCEALFIETVFTAHWTLISGYHELGKMIREASETHQVPITDLTAGIALKIHKSKRILWYAVKFYEVYPDVQNLPEGKSITWNKLVTKYLTEGTPGQKCRYCPLHCNV